jgi:hypothetical protein
MVRMRRSARFVAPGVTHHITQRGVARQLVFPTRMDRLVSRFPVSLADLDFGGESPGAF